jgi:hypothetical protein
VALIETNVYGGFAARHGLSAVVEALRPLFREGAVYISYDPVNGDALIVRTRSVFFHTLHMEDEDSYLFDGGIEGTLEEVIAFTKSLSEALESAGIDHDLHVADGPMNYVASFPESRFPEGPVR